MAPRATDSRQPKSATRLVPNPLFACGDWPALRADLDSLAGRLVSVTLVTDPFGAYDEALLKSIFDVVRRFKKHFVVDLAESDRAVASNIIAITRGGH